MNINICLFAHVSNLFENIAEQVLGQMAEQKCICSFTGFLCLTDLAVLQLREGIKDNSKIIFLISQRKHML